MNTIRVFSPLPDSEKMFEIKASQCSVLQFQNRFTGSSIATIAVSPDSDAAHYLQKKCWIVTEDDEPYIIQHRQQTYKEVRVVAYSPHFGFDGRYTIPPEGQYAIESTGSADKVVKDFIRGSTSVSARSLSVTCAPDQTGATISDQSRNKKLGEEVIRVLTGAGRGERFEWGASGITFDTYAGVDRSVSNTEGNTVCIFAGRLKNLEDYTYTEDCTTEITTPYVAGQGQGEDREIYVLGNDATGWNRRETFIDARDVTLGDVDKLMERGLQAIVGAGMQIVAEARDNINLIYGVDYNLGDIVTVQVKVKGYQKIGEFYEKTEQTLSFDLRITEVTITYDQGARSIDLTFGEVVRSKTTQLENEIAQLKATEAPAAAAIDLSNVEPNTLMQIIKANDGSGSGLDADLLDGNEATAFFSAANYETGACTLTLYGATTAGSPTYNTRSAAYVRIGALVYLWYYMNVSGLGGATGELRVSGLPFTSQNVANLTYSSQFAASSGGITLANLVGLSAYVAANSTYFGFRILTSASGTMGWTAMTNTHMPSGGTLSGILVYRKA